MRGASVSELVPYGPSHQGPQGFKSTLAANVPYCYCTLNWFAPEGHAPNCFAVIR
jgi:hypothetical protein